MNIYANGFYCAIKNDSSEVIITMIQESPIVDESGTVTGVQKERVGSYVFPLECARALAESLNGMLKPKAEE